MQVERAGMRCRALSGAAIIAMGALLAVSGCNRLTFVKQDAGRKGFERTAPEVNIRTDDRDSGSAGASLVVREGQRHLTNGDLDAAARSAGRALGLAPSSPLAHTLMAAVDDRRGNARSAGEHYLRATELAPTQGAMLNNYGTWLCGQGKAAESLQWFDRALADAGYASPSFALANAGVCADLAGQGNRALPYLTRAIELDPVNPVALGALAEREFRAGNAFRARAFSERRLAAAPADARALMLASQIEEKLGDKAAAARYVRQLRIEFPLESVPAGDGSKR